MGVILTFFQNLICWALFFHNYQRRTHFAIRFFPLCVLSGWLVYSVNWLLQSPVLGLNQPQLIMFFYFLS